MLAMEDPGTVGAEAFKQTVAKFRETYPDIELEIEEVAHEPFHTKLQVMAVAKQLPDLILLWPGKRTGYVPAAGLIKDLRPWIEGKEDLFLEGMLAGQGPNGLADWNGLIKPSSAMAPLSLIQNL